MSIHVTIVTPTYNRRAFIPALIQIYQHQTYPKEHMEWIILDDGRDKVADLFHAAHLPNLRYLYEDEKMRIGAKRNRLNKEARGSIIIAMDDDDYYPVDRVQSVVDAFTQHPDKNLAGSSEMNMYYIDQQTIWTIESHGPNHATNGTMAWRKTYANTHFYDEYVTKAEETSFLEGYKYSMIQLDPKKTILVICHSDNTVDKSMLRKQPRMKETTYTLEELVNEPALRTFYASL